MNAHTMTLHELGEAFRANQIPVSEAMLGKMIVEGRLPFAVGTTSSRGTVIPLIFRTAFYEWLREQLREEPRVLPAEYVESL